jgi:6-pyruvoyltetrahydropterin/6-carboxytetrahydropterin synthase
MKAYLSRRYRICASHRLNVAAFSEEQNRLVFGKCNHPYGHGHNYTVEVTVSGQVDETTGMVCNLADLDGCVQTLLLDRFDHANLNRDPGFSRAVPTTENFCTLIFELLSGAFDRAALERVRVEETGNNFFELERKA